MKNILNKTLFRKREKEKYYSTEKGNAIISAVFKIIEEENIPIFWYGYDYQIQIDDRIYSIPTGVPGNPDVSTDKNIVRIFNSDQRHRINSNEGPFTYCVGEPISSYQISDDVRNEIESKSKDPNYKTIYKAPQLSERAKGDEKFMKDLDYLSELGRDSKKYNL